MAGVAFDAALQPQRRLRRAGPVAGWKLASTLAWGRKAITEHGHSLRDDAFVAEASLKKNDWTLFSRGEVTENSELIEVVGDHGPAYRVGKVAVGAVRDVGIADHLSVGAGGLVALNFVPRALETEYGSSHPPGAMAFLRLRVH